MYYYQFDFQKSEKQIFSYDYLESCNYEYGIGIVWDENKSPMFLIEKVESVCIDPGDYWQPPYYEPEEIETIIVRPKLKYPKR